MTYQEPNTDEFDDEEESEGEPGMVPRAAVRGLEKKAKRADLLERENAMLRAGINVETPLGAMFVAAYEGDLTTEAIRTAFAAVAPPAPEPETDSTTEASDFEDERRKLLTGGEEDTGRQPDRDPKKAAIEAGEKALLEGKSRQDAMALAFSELVAAAAAGDERVVWNP